MEQRHEKINKLMESTVANSGALADVNMVIGKPITTNSGFQLIPFTKVTVGNLSGGGEYGDIKVIKETDSVPFAGGSGSVISMKPMGFLVDDGTTCRILRITDEPLDNLIERATEIMRDIVAKD